MALSAPAEQYRVHFFPFFLRKTFSLVVHYFVPGSIPRKAHKLRNQKYLKLPFLPPNQSIKRNRLLFWLNMRSIFFFYAHSAFQIKNARRKEKELLSSMKKEKKKRKGEICFYLEKHTHQIPTAKKSRNICAESSILPAQILKEFIPYLPVLEWDFQNGCNRTDD